MYIPPEIRASLDEVERRAGYLWKFLDVPGKQAAIAKLEEQMTAQNFWDSQKAAQKVISECNGHKVIVAPQVAFRRQIDDAKTLAELSPNPRTAPPTPKSRNCASLAPTCSPPSPSSRSPRSSPACMTAPTPS